MEEQEFIDQMIARLRSVKACMKKREKLSQKALGMNVRDNTPRQIQKANTELNWECMNLDKSIVDFARAYKGSMLDVHTGEREYNPSGFHCYKH